MKTHSNILIELQPGKMSRLITREKHLVSLSLNDALAVGQIGGNHEGGNQSEAFRRSGGWSARCQTLPASSKPAVFDRELLLSPSLVTASVRHYSDYL